MFHNQTLVADPITGRTMTAAALDILKLARADALESGYRLDENDRVIGPGRFEGESVDVFYFHGAMMDGDGDTVHESEDGGSSTLTFILSDPEREAFDAGGSAVAAVLDITSDGFAMMSYVDRDGLAGLANDDGSELSDDGQAESVDDDDARHVGDEYGPCYAAFLTGVLDALAERFPGLVPADPFAPALK